MTLRPFSTTSGAVFALVPLPWAVRAWTFGDAPTPLWSWGVVAVAAAAALFAAWTMGRRPKRGRSAATLALGATFVLAAPQLAHSPGATLAGALVAAGAVSALWRFGPALLVRRRRGHVSSQVRGAAASYLVLWFLATLLGDASSVQVWWAVGASAALVAGLVVQGTLRNWRALGIGSRALLFVAVGLAGVAVTSQSLETGATLGALLAVAALILGPRLDDGSVDADALWTAIFEGPERLLVATFAALSALGTLLLALPQCAAEGVGIGLLDAAFTAVSAVCVTGLVVRDTPVDFTPLGQAIILLLIQLGGLGIMTFSTAVLRVLGRRLSYRQESAVAHLVGAKDRSRLVASAQDVLKVTFVAEGIGALALFGLFLGQGEPIGSAAWKGGFTAVSAYCNAGFALDSDSLVPFQSSPAVLHVVGVLIVLGGLSPAVVLALGRRRTGARRLSLHAKLCLVSTALLVAVGFSYYLANEWAGTLAHLSIADKLHNAWFQSITLRTAGFNSVDTAAVHPATTVMMMVWMFIGGCPGGTAGGVKVTTVAVLLLSVVHTIRGKDSITSFGRTVPERTVRKAAVIVTVAFGFTALAMVALMTTQRIPAEMLAFETVSALGTVGLSQGATAELDAIGKLVVVACMFVGRVGGLAAIMFMAQSAVRARFALPVEDVNVG